MDYIFGGATAVFENCEMYTAQSGTAICAPNTKSSIPYGFVFLGGKATAATSIAKGSQHLARNWGANGATAYLRTELGAHIAAAGWKAMGTNKLSDARFAEYKTTGPGATLSARVSEAKQLTDAEAAAYTVQKILAPWNPSFSQ